jgi:hypothetical protein
MIVGFPPKGSGSSADGLAITHDLVAPFLPRIGRVATTPPLIEPPAGWKALPSEHTVGIEEVRLRSRPGQRIVSGDVAAIAFALLACAFALYKLLSGSTAEPRYGHGPPEARSATQPPSEEARRGAADGTRTSPS